MDYAGLHVAMSGFLNRGDLYQSIPTFIALAEAALNRDLRSRRMIGRDTASIATEFYALPTDFLEAISVSLDGTYEDLDGLAVDALIARKALAATRTGTPEAYAIVGGSLQFFPAPSAAVAVILSYYQALPALSASNTSNWLLAAFPDLYLYGALLQAAAFLAPDPRLATWGELYTAALETARLDGVKSQHGARPTPYSPYVV